jgi:hypothetical protein
VRHPAGSTLVEVMLALGLLGTFLVATVGLMALGLARLHAGGLRTQAISRARAIVEELSSGGIHRMPRRLGSDSGATSCRVDTRTSAAGTAWQAALDRELRGGHAEIQLESLGSPPPGLEHARAIRVTVTVFWPERGRERFATLTTVQL